MKMQFLVSLVVLAMASCATTGPVSGGSKISYAESARQNFESGERAMAAERNEEAVAIFEYVRNKYPYSRYAADSDLKIADIQFLQEEWVAAAEAYATFVSFHPVHENVAYAVFRQAKSNYNAMPVDFFLFPKAYTKDQTLTKEALVSVEKYLKQFPTDTNVKEAQEMRVKLRDQLAFQNMYVADFYAARKKWKGAAARYEEISKNFSDTQTGRRAILKLAHIKKDYLEKKDEAKELMQRLTQEFPESDEAVEAQRELKQ